MSHSNWGPVTVEFDIVTANNVNMTTDSNNTNPNVQQISINYWNDATMLIEHAKKLWENKDVEEAKNCIERSLTLQPEEMIFYIFAIQFYLAFDFVNQSYRHCENAISFCEGIESRQQWLITFYWIKCQLLFNDKKFHEIIFLMTNALKIKHDHNDITYNWRGAAHCELKLYNKAIDDFTNAIKRAPRPASYHNSRGTCYQELKKFDKALSDYNRALSLEPKNISATNNRASLFIECKQFHDALADCNQGLKLLDTHGNLHKHRGMAHFGLGCYDAAITDVNRAIELCPHYRPARVALKRIWDFYVKNVMNVVLELSSPQTNNLRVSANKKKFNFLQYIFLNKIQINANGDNTKIINKNFSYLQECSIEIVHIIVDYAVGNNYVMTNDMVDATYSDITSQINEEMDYIDEHGNLITVAPAANQNIDSNGHSNNNVDNDNNPNNNVYNNIHNMYDDSD